MAGSKSGQGEMCMSEPREQFYGRRRGRPLRVGQRERRTTLLPQLTFALPETGQLNPVGLFTAPPREIYEKIFGAVARKLGMNPCPEAVDYLFERYYSRGRCTRASDCRDLLETVTSICRFRRIPLQLTRDLMAEASASFIREFK